MPRASYEVRVVGEVPPHMLEDFEGLTISPQGAESTIHVPLGDEAELHGLLEALSRSGYALIDVRKDELDPARCADDEPPSSRPAPVAKNEHPS